MKNYFFLLVITLNFFCNQKSKVKKCDEFAGMEFKGEVVIFFHKPISGSTYQIFLFPFCNNVRDKESEVGFSWPKVGTGISFNITSDNPQFQTLNKNVQKIDLKDREHLAQNFRAIYYCLAKIEIFYSDLVSNIKVESMVLTFDKSRKVLRYRFVSFGNLKTISIIGNGNDETAFP